MNIKNYKYLLVLVLALFIGCKDTYAVTNEKICTYVGDNFQGYVTLEEKNNGNIKIKKFKVAYFNDKSWTSGVNTAIVNENGSYYLGSNFWQNKKEYGYQVPKITVSKNANGEIVCPRYAVATEIKTSSNVLTKIEVALLDGNEADQAVSKLTSLGKNAYKSSNSDIFLQQHGVDCDGADCIVCENGVTGDDCNISITCGNIDTIFGSRNDENSLAFLINQVMTYIRIIVPILIILLGMIDIAKAVISSKEDEMKKAQTTFIKRVIAGIGLFFVPALVNVVIQLANIVWEEDGNGYETCNIEVLK